MIMINKLDPCIVYAVPKLVPEGRAMYAAIPSRCKREQIWSPGCGKCVNVIYEETTMIIN